MDLLLVLAGAVAGAVAATIGKVVDHILTRSSRRDDQQNRDQRETLLEIQDVMLEMSGHLGSLQGHLSEYVDENHYDWERPLTLAYEMKTFRDDVTPLKASDKRLTVIRERVLDDDVRRGVEAYQTACWELLIADTETIGWASARTADATYNLVNVHIGRLLRERY